MNLTYHIITEEEAREVCSWKYPGEYSCYDLPSYEELKARNSMFGNPLRVKNFRSYYDGELFVGITNLVEEEKEVFLGISVHPDLCSKGYGSVMVNTAYKISHQLYPNKPLYLTVRIWNKRAIRCYEKAGFVIDGKAFELKARNGLFYRMIRN